MLPLALAVFLGLVPLRDSGVISAVFYRIELAKPEDTVRHDPAIGGRQPASGEGQWTVAREPRPRRKQSSFPRRSPPRRLVKTSNSQDKQMEQADAWFYRAQERIREFTRSGWSAAMQDYARALGIYQKIRLAAREATVREAMASLYYKMRKRRLALEYYESASVIYMRIGDSLGTARVTAEMGRCHYSLEEYEQARQLLKRALVIYREKKARDGEARVLGLMGLVHAWTGKSEQALNHFKKAVALSGETGDEGLQCEVLFNLSLFYYRTGEYRQEAEILEGILPRIRRLGDRYLEANILNDLGVAYQTMGNPERALLYLDESVGLYQAMGIPTLGVCYSNLGEIYAMFGDWPQALTYFQKARELFRELESRNPEASTLFYLSEVHAGVGDHQQALSYRKQALAIFREIGNENAAITVLAAMGGSHHALGALETALAYHQQALALAVHLGNRSKKAQILTQLGQVTLSVGDPSEAICYFEEALALQQALGLRGEIASTHHALARAHLALNQFVVAEDNAQRALALFREMGSRQEEAFTLYTLSQIDGAHGRLENALATSQAGLEIIESLRIRIRGRHLRTSYFAESHSLYAYHVDLLMRLADANPSGGHVERALYASERARARTMLELLNELPLHGRQQWDSALLQRKNQIQKLLNGKAHYRLQVLQDHEDTESLAQLDLEIDTLLAEYRALETRLLSQGGRFAGLIHTRPLTVPEIQQQLLNEQTVLLEYLLGPTRSFVWLVTTDSVRVFPLPPQDAIERLARRVYNQGTARNHKVKFEIPEERARRIARADADYVETGLALSRMLLGPVMEYLEGQRLIIAGDGALWFVPFGALPHPETEAGSRWFPLIREHTVVTAPSASVLAALKRLAAAAPGHDKTLAIFADPVFSEEDPRVRLNLVETEETQPITFLSSRLMPYQENRRGNRRLPRIPFTRREAEVIAKLVPDDQRFEALGFLADRNAVLNTDLADFRILHFATHGILDSKHPELSGLALSMVDEVGRQVNGFLSQQDIYNLRLNADLVVLSACQTALGKEIKGEGLVGLTQGFMYAGASRVTASLWHIQDEATAELMTEFYRGMLVRRQDPAKALRDAQLAMWRATRWRSPYFWGAFVFMGPWS